MKIIYKNKKEEAIKLLKNNGVIAIATDTVYGLCARINSKEAFDKFSEFYNKKLIKLKKYSLSGVKHYSNIKKKIESIKLSK